MSGKAKKMIEKMLSLNPDKRPQIEQILNSKWMNDQIESSSE